MKPTDFYRLILDVNLRIIRRRIQAVSNQSQLMFAVMTAFVVTYWIAGYLLFQQGFRFLITFPVMGAMLVDQLLYLFFAFLFLMLIFSNMIIGYSTIFKSYETQWMLTLPVRHTDVFRCKLIETAILSSWAFLFLSAPMLLAYGHVRGVNAWFYIQAFLLFIPFTVIPACIGALIILVITRFFHRRLFKFILFGAGATAIFAALILLKPAEVVDLPQAQSYAILTKLMINSSVTVHPLWPSVWVTRGLIAWGDGAVQHGSFYFLLLLSNALMAGWVCMTVSIPLFYRGWSRNHAQGDSHSQASWWNTPLIIQHPGILERLLHFIPWLSPPFRALIVKDIKVFWRDTSQWSQFVIFFGLLALYVINLRNISYQWRSEFWGQFIAFLNLGTSTMTLATLTTRFVYPQFSLEGKRLWMVGMMPNGLRQVIIEKFLLSSICSTVITLTLTLVSCASLNLPATLTLMFSVSIVLMSFALCSIAVGVGALFPNFGHGSTANRLDDNPARVVSGFGGTFCFVISLVYIILVTGAEALPMYELIPLGRFLNIPRHTTLMFSVGFVVILSLVAIFVPMRLALKRVNAIEL